MNDAVTFLVGCFTFLAVNILKKPIKKWNRKRAGGNDPQYRRRNMLIFLLVMAVSVGSYYVLYRLVELDHFKLCCTLKAGAMAVAIYAVYEQWTGSSLAETAKERKEENASAEIFQI